MRTTLILDDDLADKLAQISKESDRPFKAVVNDILRRGLADQVPTPPFTYEPDAGNPRPGIGPRRLNELASRLDEEAFIR